MKTEWTNHDKPNISPHQPTNKYQQSSDYRYYSASELLFLFFWAATFQNNLLVWGDRHDVADELAGASVSSPPTACAIDCIWVNMGQLPSKSHKCAKSKHFKTFCMGSGHPSHHGNPFEECSMQISMNWLMMIDDHTIPYPNMGNLSSFIQALAMPHITTGTRKTYEPMVWELFSPNGHSERMASENHTSSSSAWHVTAPTCTTAQLPLCNIPMDSGCKMMQKSAHTALAVKACLLGGNSNTKCSMTFVNIAVAISALAGGGPKTVSHRDQNTVVFSTFFRGFLGVWAQRVLKWNFGSFW